MSEPVELLRTAYSDLSELLYDLAADGMQWETTGCRGWAVADLGHHLLSDARRALVALATPARRESDTDAVTYWRSWQPPEPGEDEDIRRTRAASSVGLLFADLVETYAETSAAVVVAADRVSPADVVATQGRSLTVADLVSTLVVEAAVHHLDLVVRLDRPGPSASPLAEVRRVLEGLLGRPLPPGWDDVTAARRGTGREPLTAADRDELGAGADAFPLFG